LVGFHLRPCHNKVGFSTVRIVFPLRADFNACFNLISFSKPDFDRNSSVCVTNKVDFSTVRIVFPLRADFNACFNLISFSKPDFDRNSSVCVTNKVDFSTIRIVFPLCADSSAHFNLISVFPSHSADQAGLSNNIWVL
jgi:hypothetical protein